MDENKKTKDAHNGTPGMQKFSFYDYDLWQICIKALLMRTFLAMGTLL